MLGYFWVCESEKRSSFFTLPLMRKRCHRMTAARSRVPNVATDAQCVRIWWQDVSVLPLARIARAIPCGIAYIKINDYSLWIIYIIPRWIVWQSWARDRETSHVSIWNCLCVCAKRSARSAQLNNKSAIRENDGHNRRHASTSSSCTGTSHTILHSMRLRARRSSVRSSIINNSFVFDTESK